MSSQLNEIYVLDTETTGLKGAPTDLVVDIAICRVLLKECIVEEVYSSVVGHDVSNWNNYLRNAWIFENTDMTLEMVSQATPFEEVKEKVKEILKGKNVTSYNVKYDMDGFLYKSPWDLKYSFNECKDIMLAAMNVCKIPSLYYDSYKYPKLCEAYDMIVDGDPAGIHGTQEHRAFSDTVMASHVMIQMFRDGNYSP